MAPRKLQSVVRALRRGKGPASLGPSVNGGFSLVRRVATRGVGNPHALAVVPANLPRARPAARVIRFSGARGRAFSNRRIEKLVDDAPAAGRILSYPASGFSTRPRNRIAPVSTSRIAKMKGRSTVNTVG